MIVFLGCVAVLFKFGTVEQVLALQSSVPPDTSKTVKSDSSRVDSLRMNMKAMPTFRKHENKAFAVGEHLVFEVAYKFIVAGTATMSIPDTQWVRGRPCYHVVTTAQSNKFFDSVFRVRDRVETFIDMEGIFPWKFEKHIREGKYRSDRYVEYDQINRRAIHNKKDTLEVPPYIQGVLSSFYYVRTVPLKVKKAFDIDNYGDGKLYPLKVLVHKKMRVEVPAGVFDCIVVEPVLRGEGIFNQKGRMAIWLTDDERRIPVLMKSKVLIGSIDVRLKSIEKINR
jgi:hypothetical protein